MTAKRKTQADVFAMDDTARASYDHDVCGWANEQAALLRSGRYSVADIENVAEEIESFGKSQKSELMNRLTVLLLHLLKWQFQPKTRGRSWELSIKEQRRKVAIHMRDNPSLKPSLAEAIEDAYSVAMVQAQQQTNLKAAAFPDRCPYSFAEAMDEGFCPG